MLAVASSWYPFFMNRLFVALPVVMAAFVLGAAEGGCGSEVSSGPGDASADGSSGGFNTNDGAPGSSGGYTAGDGGAGTCVPLVNADGTSPQCANCIDDDGDGLVDALDFECAGPLDNDEKTFGTGIAGDNVDACKQDCFFDGNSGQGDDRCEWNLKCDPKVTTGECTYDPNFKNCPATQRDECINKCAKLAPNGCDCFGCCNIQLPGGGSKDVRLSSTCSLADINDPTKCPPCTPTTGCQNPCDRCELCIGKTSIPADCAVSAPD
ncbi:MAG: Erythrocyte rane protein 1, partial [Labilithrix sp.]|nr:Erythrocyte rane protein 1 [Labilithrix sp.]